ncbi:MAG: glycosyltransferase family 39 protein [Clostridiales bacterium]|nr:glycosyltransferase family 39 protein [Clostridiales bacterium]
MIEPDFRKLEKKAFSARSIVILLLILTLAAVLRLQHLKADPPQLLVHLCRSAGIYFDEAMYCHNARNKILFDTWTFDDWNPILYNAVLTGIYYVGFKIFGISIATVKVTNILFGLLGIIFVYLAIRRYLSESYALGLSFLFSLDFYWTMYNRIGLLENFSTLFFIISFYFLVKSKDKRGAMPLVGVSVAMAVLSKYLFFYFFPAALLAILYHSWSEKRWRPVAHFLAGFFSVLFVWFVSIYLPLSSAFRKIGSGWMELSWPENVGIFFFNLYRNNLSRYMSLIPFLFIAGLLFSAMVIVRLVKKNPPPDVLEVFVFLWLTGTFFQMAILNYQPLRYYLVVVPGLFFALSLAVKNRDWLKANAKPVALTFVFLGALFYKFWIGLVRPPSAFFAFNHIVLRIPLYLTLALIFVLWLRKSRQMEKAALLYVLVSLALASLFVYYSQFYKKPSYQVESAARRLRLLPSGSVIMGNEAPRLALETDFRFFVAFPGWFNDKDPFNQYRPTHLLVLDKFWGGELVWIQKRFPEVAANLRLHRRFPVWDTTVSLYKVNYPDKPADHP